MNRVKQAEWKWAAIRAAILIVLSTLPYLIAWTVTPDDLFFPGFLINPEDGQSYLAKMRQGWRGEWLFRLPYTPETHQGEFLYTFYLALGHVARWTGLPLIVVFHLARALAGFGLLLIVYDAAACFFPVVAHRRFAFVLTAIGSGFGWLLIYAGGTPVDIRVPEGYIFYSLFVNAHFPFGIAMMWLILRCSVTPWGQDRVEWKQLVGVGAATIGLGLVQPFCLATVGAVLALYALVLWAQRRRPPLREIASGVLLGATSAPILLNAYLAFARNPAFASWSAQNQTLSPPPWDYALGYGLVLILALAGLVAALRRRRDSDWLLVVWVLCTAVLVYLPISLQRRLITGFMLPLGSLATLGWVTLCRRRRLRPVLLWALSGLTHATLIVIALFGAFTEHPALFVSRNEVDAMRWMSVLVPQDALVIAAPGTGLYIPTYGGQRVFYGHPYETANAELRAAQLDHYFSNGDEALFEEPTSLKADYIYYGPREAAYLGTGWLPHPDWPIVYNRDGIALFEMRRMEP